jgi:O-antigen/teichoic acid export membrane protein
LSSLGIFATKVVAKPFNIAVSIIAANFLGPADKGVAAWIMVLVSISAYVFGFGCGSAIRFLLAGRTETLKHLAWTSIVMGLVNGLVGSFSILLLVQVDLLGSLTHAIPQSIKWVIIVSIPLMVVESVLNRALIGEARYKFINQMELGSAVLYPLLLMLFIFVFEWGLFGANLAFFATRGSSFLATIIYVFREYAPIRRFDWDFCRRSYSYGLRIWIGGLSIFLNMYLDSLFVGWTMSAATMGNYSIAVTIARSVMMMPQAINIVLTNRLIGLDRHQAVREAVMLHRSTFWIVALASAILGAIGYFVLPIAMPEFEETPIVFLILLVGSICSASFTILNSFFASQGMPGRSSIAQLVGFLVGGIVTPILVWKWSGIGGAIGSSMIYLIIAVIMWYFLWQQNSREAMKAFAFRLADWKWIMGQMRAATIRFRGKPAG